MIEMRRGEILASFFVGDCLIGYDVKGGSEPVLIADKRHCSMPHVGWEQDEQTFLRFDQFPWRVICPIDAGRLTKTNPAIGISFVRS